jgi:hypothetical protein
MATPTKRESNEIYRHPQTPADYRLTLGYLAFDEGVNLISHKQRPARPKVDWLRINLPLHLPPYRRPVLTEQLRDLVPRVKLLGDKKHCVSVLYCR